MNLTLFSIPPPPQILGSSGPHALVTYFNLWRQRLAPYLVLYGRYLGGRGPRVLGADTLRHSLPWPLHVDRTLRECLVTCSPRHLASLLFHSYISTAHSFNLHGLCFIHFCLFSVDSGYEPRVLRTTRELLASLIAIRVGQDRDSQIVYNIEYFVFKAEFINLYWAAEIIPTSEKICIISF